MKIVVIGLGSMGKRRIRLIKELYPNYTVIGVDGREDRCNEVVVLFQIQTYTSISEIKEDIRCAFICTSPLSHSSLIRECLERGWNVFTELNLVDTGYTENMKLSKDKNLVLFISSTFLYREEIRYIKSRIVDDNRWNYIYHIGQYLPDWHPWENYRDFFIGDKRTNGCREILAIELPWLINVFGKVIDNNAISDKISTLNIDYNDNFMIQLKHENGNKGMLIVDVVSPLAVRKMEIYTEGSYLSWNGTPETLCEYDNNRKELVQVQYKEKSEHYEGYKDFIVENAYKNEIRDFFDVVCMGKEPIYGFEKDRNVLNLINGIGA